MDADQYVAIETIANFNAVKKLTQDLTLIIDVLRGKFNYKSIVDSSQCVQWQLS